MTRLMLYNVLIRFKTILIVFWHNIKFRILNQTEFSQCCNLYLELVRTLISWWHRCSVESFNQWEHWIGVIWPITGLENVKSNIRTCWTPTKVPLNMSCHFSFNQSCNELTLQTITLIWKKSWILYYLMWKWEVPI